MAKTVTKKRERLEGLSYSGLSSYLQCEQKWAIQYITRLRFAGGEALFIGSLFHELLANSYERGHKLTDAQMNRIFQRVAKEEYSESNFNLARAYGRVTVLYERYCIYYPEDFDPELGGFTILEVEQQRSDGIIMGIADVLLERDGMVVLREHKTKGKLESQPADFQRDFYSRLWPEIDLVEYNMVNTYDYKNPPESLTKVFLRSPTFSTKDNQARLDMTLQRALGRMEEMRQGSTPMANFCYNVCRFCDFKAECPAQLGLPLGKEVW